MKNDSLITPEPRKQKSTWDILDIGTKIAISFVGLVFTIAFGILQYRLGMATIELSRSNLAVVAEQKEIAKINVEASLVPYLSSNNPKQRGIALFLASSLDTQFAVKAASFYAISDPDRYVRENATSVLRSLSEVQASDIKQAAEKGLAQVSVMNELRNKGLLDKIYAARYKLDLSQSNEQRTAAMIYHDVLGRLSPESIKKLNHTTLAEAENMFEKGFFGEAVTKYEALFNDFK